MIEEGKNCRRTKSPNEMKRRKNSSMFLSERREDCNKENEERRVVKSTIVNKKICNNIKITNYFGDRKNKIIVNGERKIIKAFSYGLTKDQIDYLSSLSK